MLNRGLHGYHELSASGGCETTLGVSKNLKNLLARYAFIPLQEIADRRASFKIVEQHCYG